jgi:hypothetical protein
VLCTISMTVCIREILFSSIEGPDTYTGGVLLSILVGLTLFNC